LFSFTSGKRKLQWKRKAVSNRWLICITGLKVIAILWAFILLYFSCKEQYYNYLNCCKWPLQQFSSTIKNYIQNLEGETQSPYAKLSFSPCMSIISNFFFVGGGVFKWKIMMQTNTMQVLLSNCNDGAVMLMKIQFLWDVKQLPFHMA
jgi:hypothetical protein